MPLPDAMTCAQMREHDRLAIEELGLPAAVLMENAGAGAMLPILDFLSGKPRQAPGVIAASRWKAVVLCGGGNNGGDGYVLARHLHNAGLEVSVHASVPFEAMRGEAQLFRGVCARMGMDIQEASGDAELVARAREWERADILIDALLGTGFQGELRPGMAALIRIANGLQRPRRASLDVPSGLDGDTGVPASVCFRADLTVTFVAPKTGFAAPSARPWIGQLAVTGIGTPPELRRRVREGGEGARGD